MPSQLITDEGSATSGEPPTVRSARYLIYLGIVALVLGLVGLFFWHDTIRLGIERDHPDWSGTRISAEVLTHQAGAAVFAVLLVVFWLWLDDKVEQAKPWAPAVFAVLAAIAAVGALQMALDDAFPDASKVGVLAGAGIGLVSAALPWAPASRSYFART